ncbi:MAG: hypothetical protein COB20_02675 [SAR86 cluster bacterium]|uniref:Response regulatory domain-containing protein n=1 Tax=SAR86 cluster bacterium TaxID=2030880 RepID=A0A2A4XDS1_9GAMM|nr:MAG: hypothetical protein COB20_02675 [SAR86 cluster bacterium]
MLFLKPRSIISPNPLPTEMVSWNWQYNPSIAMGLALRILVLATLMVLNSAGELCAFKPSTHEYCAIKIWISIDEVMSVSATPEARSALKVLAVDDDTFISDLLKRLATKVGCAVHCIHDGAEVGNALLAYRPEIIFLDLVLPGIDGVEIIRILAKAECKAKIVLMSGLDKRTLSSVEEVAKKSKLDVIGAISKPFEPGQIEGILQPLVESKRTASLRVDSTTQTETCLGPHLSYEPEQSLSESSEGSTNWARVSYVWKLDDEQLMDIDSILDETVKPRISRGIIEVILRTAKSDKENGVIDPLKFGLKIALPQNLLSDESTPDYLSELVQASGLGNQNILFEIDENAIINSSDTTSDVLSRLKIKGFKLAVCVKDQSDQVLAALDKLPVDEIVVNMATEQFGESYINNTETEFQVASLVSYAAGAGLVTSVKNAASDQQLNFAKRCNFQKASGLCIQSPSDGISAMEFFKRA